MKYCRGQGLDLGCGNSKIRKDAIGIDLYNPAADMKTDARQLQAYKNESFDYIFSSHLLEEFQDPIGVITEWLRVIKQGGYLVLYQVDSELYYPIGHPLCNKSHQRHFSIKEMTSIFEKIGGVTITHTYRNKDKEWSFEFVVRKGENFTDRVLTEDGISLLIPTLNRPLNMEAFTKSVSETIQYPDKVEIVFGVHEEDLLSIAKVSELQNQCKFSVRYEIINRYHDNKINLPFLWNQLYAKSKYPIVGYFGDDCLFHTPAWDTEVRIEFHMDKTVMVACNDVHIQQGKTATLFFTHKQVHDLFGFYLPERFRRWYNDTYWDVIYRAANKLHYREDLYCEHNHPTVFKEKTDNVYLNMELFKNSDSLLWYSPATKEELFRNSQILKELKNV